MPTRRLPFAAPAAATAAGFVLIALSVASPAGAAAQTTSAPDAVKARRPIDAPASTRREVAVTAYNNNLGLVREVRELTGLPQGEFDLNFLDVPALINPRTVSLRSLEKDGVSVVEQNYEYDLTSPQRLLQKYLGRDLLLVETAENLQDRVTPARLLATDQGNVFESEGKILVGHPGRIVLPDLPEGLYARPALVWKLANNGPATQKIEASYMTDGISWSADYVAIADPQTARVDLTGWVTLENRSGAAYENALLKLVAGEVQRVSSPGMKMMAAEGRAMAAAPAFSEQGFFEYHLYTLEHRTDIHENQTKQILLLQGRGVPVVKKLVLYGDENQFRGRFGGMGENLPVAVTLEVPNTKAAGLGIPLPAGIVRLYQQDRDGAQQFAGEDRINHTPRDETVRLRLGNAFDVVADRVQTDWKKIGVLPYDAEAAFEIRLRNHKDEAVTVTVRESLPQADWKVLEASPEGKKKDARTLEFEVPVPANGAAVVRYRVALKM